MKKSLFSLIVAAIAIFITTETLNAEMLMTHQVRSFSGEISSKVGLKELKPGLTFCFVPLTFSGDSIIKKGLNCLISHENDTIVTEALAKDTNKRIILQVVPMDKPFIDSHQKEFGLQYLNNLNLKGYYVVSGWKIVFKNSPLRPKVPEYALSELTGIPLVDYVSGEISLNIAPKRLRAGVWDIFVITDESAGLGVHMVVFEDDSIFRSFLEKKDSYTGKMTVAVPLNVELVDACAPELGGGGKSFLMSLENAHYYFGFHFELIPTDDNPGTEPK